MYAPAPQRTASALASLLIVGGGLLVLALGLSGVVSPTTRTAALEAILPNRNAPPPPPAARQPQHDASGARDDAASPSSRHPAARITAPPALVVPPPVLISPTAGNGSAIPPGASTGTGSGQGSGGAGSGTGGGGAGGDGLGGGRHDVSAYPRQLAGKLHFWEIPKELRQDHGGVIRLRYRIGIDGRVSDCSVLQSSGVPAFDRDTCARITERFRFSPARDSRGNPVAFMMTETHGWDYQPDG